MGQYLDSLCMSVFTATGFVFVSLPLNCWFIISQVVCFFVLITGWFPPLGFFKTGSQDSG